MKPQTALLIVLALLLTDAAAAQQTRNVFENPQNLQVLPEDIAPQDLGRVMRGFALGLGLRCESCHVGEAGQPLSTFDFESDEKAMKRKARLMLEMTRTINTTLVPTLDDVEKAERVEVRCVTCHRGQPQPRMIWDVLDEELAENGVEGAVAEYRSLRQQFYGSHSYDFSEITLPTFARSLAGRAQLEAAIAFAELNLEYFPESFYSVATLAELYESSGNAGQAIASYKRAIELNPAMEPRITPRIEALQATLDQG